MSTPRKKSTHKSAKATKAATRDAQEQRRQRQRDVCAQMLERWVPIASPELAVRREGRSGPVIDEAAMEDGLKAGAIVLKLLERLAKLDGLDAAEKREVTVRRTADPLELARRVQAVSPILMARLRQQPPLLLEPATGKPEPGPEPGGH